MTDEPSSPLLGQRALLNRKLLHLDYGLSLHIKVNARTSGHPKISPENEREREGEREKEFDMGGSHIMEEPITLIFKGV